MDSSSGQEPADNRSAGPNAAGRSRPRAQATRAALLAAAAELVGERGWAAVSTRAIAERAGLPHGAVSYHFNGKADLLREAILRALDESYAGVASALIRRSGSVQEVVNASSELADLDTSQLVLLAEALIQAPRDERLRDGLSRQLARYRESLTVRVAQDMRAGAVTRDVSARGLALLIAAALDGLVLHSVADPGADFALGCQTLAALLKPRE